MMKMKLCESCGKNFFGDSCMKCGVIEKVFETNALQIIFDYYSIAAPALRNFWEKDLRGFSEQQIFDAFNEYRQNETTRHKKPKSLDIVDLIKKKINDKKNQTIFSLRARDDLKRGRSFVEDILIERIERMKINNPRLEKMIKDCDRASEKLLICQIALGEQNKISESWKNFFSKLIEKSDEQHTKNN